MGGRVLKVVRACAGEGAGTGALIEVEVADDGSCSCSHADEQIVVACGSARRGYARRVRAGGR